MGGYKKLKIAFWIVYALFFAYIFFLVSGKLDLASNHGLYIAVPLILYCIISTTIHFLIRKEKRKSFGEKEFE